MGRKTPRKPGSEKPTPRPQGAGSAPKPWMWLGIGVAVIGAVLLGRQLAKPRSTKVETPKTEVAASQPSRGPLPITPIVEPEKEAHAQYAGSQSCKACHAEL